MFEWEVVDCGDYVMYIPHIKLLSSKEEKEPEGIQLEMNFGYIGDSGW